MTLAPKCWTNKKLLNFDAFGPFNRKRPSDALVPRINEFATVENSASMLGQSPRALLETRELLRTVISSADKIRNPSFPPRFLKRFVVYIPKTFVAPSRTPRVLKGKLRFRIIISNQENAVTSDNNIV